MTVTMNQLELGMGGHVSHMVAVGSLRNRLYDMGLTPGTYVESVMVSPIGDPICFRVRGALIALRSSDAEQVIVSL